MHSKIKQIAIELTHIGVMSYYVGGCVRDEIMSGFLAFDSDIDVCLVGVTDPTQVEAILLQHSESVTPLVGKKFPVWIATIDGKKVDFAMARIETLVGDSRTDFDVVTEGVTLKDDLRRRDFTMNAIAKEVIHGEIIDPFNGAWDIAHSVLHYTSDAFKEDTLRVYRAARFLSRFPELKPSAPLVKLCKILKPTDTSNERVGMELMKTMEQALIPSTFFTFLNEIGWLKYHFKEVEDLIGVPQNPNYHPEGDVFTHTMYALNQAQSWFIRTVMLCHDLGKATTTTFHLDGHENEIKWMPEEGHISVKNMPIESQKKMIEECKIKSIGHEEAGKPLTRSMLTRIHFTDHKTIRQIETLVGLHMIRNGVNEKVIRRSLRILMNMGLEYNQLVQVCRCDVSGRPPLAPYTPDIGQHRAEELLKSGAMNIIVTGEKLIEVGYTPGPLLGELVKMGLEWQDRGTLNEYNWLKMIKQYKPKTKVS